MQDKLFDTHEQLTSDNRIMKGLLEFINERLLKVINDCKRAPTDVDGYKDLRKIHVAGFAVCLLQEIRDKKVELISK